jgi:hypothetical protein
MMNPRHLLLFLAVLVACSIAFALLLPIVLEHFKGARGGWRGLARAYATTEQPTGEIWRRRSVVAGSILYRFCVTVGIDKPGLYLVIVSPLPMLRQTPLLVPWSAFQRVEPARLFWRRAALISIGAPLVGTLTVPMELYAHMRPHLPKALASFATTGG